MSWTGNQHELSESGISVAEVEQSTGTAGVFSSLLDAYQGQGYERGYQRGVADVLASMLALTEAYLSEKSIIDPAFRRALYGFESYIERYMLGPPKGEFVSEGLGI